jgi:hypothetical protein
VAQYQDQGSFFDACDSSTGCHQEMWSFQGLQEAQKAYVEHKQAMKSPKASLALLNKTSKGLVKLRKSKKAKEAKAKSNVAKGATKVPEDPMKAAFQVNLEKAKKPPRTPRVQRPLLQARCLRSTRICSLLIASTRGTRSLLSRQKAICL